MELYQLRTFEAVAEEGQLKRASERLHLSQPAVSAHVKALEETLGVRLFARTSEGMELTAAGRSLLELARKTLAAAEEMKRAARALKGEISGQLRIGTLSSPDFIRLGDVLSRTVEYYPQLELELSQEVAGEALEGVQAGRLDASFYLGGALPPGIAGIALTQMVYCIAGPASWKERLAKAGWSELAQMPWIVTPPDGAIRQIVAQLFTSRGLEPPTRHVETDNTTVMSNLVASGVGVSLIREDLAREMERAGEVCVWDKADARTTLWFIHRAERADDPLIGALLKVLNEVWQAPESPQTAARRKRANARRPPPKARRA